MTNAFSLFLICITGYVILAFAGVPQQYLSILGWLAVLFLGLVVVLARERRR